MKKTMITGKKSIDGEKIYYAFVDGIESLEDGRTIIQFDSIEVIQIDQFDKSELTHDEIESLKPTMIRCDFDSSVYAAFKKMNEETVEGNWLVLNLTYNPTEFQVEYIPEYFEGNPEIFTAYIFSFQNVNSESKQKLESFFEIKENEKELNQFIRQKKLKQLWSKDKPRNTSKLDIVVYNVGQGSMNAILDERGIPITYFDVGGGSYWNAHTYNAPNPRMLCFTNDPVIILSHWDCDHWWTFNKLIRNKLLPPGYKTTWIVPFQKFGVIQKRFYNLLKQNGHIVLIWQNKSKCTFDFGQIVKCHYKGTSLNNSGLVLKIKMGTLNFLLPGDACYKYIPNLKNETYNGLVATHHGGLCTATLSQYPIPNSDDGKIVYSLGLCNTYHHPSLSSVAKHGRAGWLNIKGTIKGSVSFLSKRKRKAPCHGRCALDIDQIF